jgi:hypothetical protein
MRRPIADADYSQVVFGDASDISAFVAALSRALASPVGRAMLTADAHVEVWIADETHPHVYLSAGAVVAATAFFAAPVVIATIPGRDLPADLRPVIDGLEGPALGMEDAARLLDRS